MEMRQVLAQVAGRVQGVGYRFWTKERAEELGLTGWVQNEPDGTVKVLLQGDNSQIEKMLKQLKSGPAFARVEQVSSEEVDQQLCSSFAIIR